MSYLTSTHALNPLPNRPILSSSSLPVSIPNLPPFDQAPFNGRPRKIVSDTNNIGMGIPSTNIVKPPEQMQHVNGVAFPTLANSQNLVQQQGDRGTTAPFHMPLSSHNTAPNPQPSTPFPSQSQLTDKIANESNSDTSLSNVNEPVTAIFRPDDTWRDQLRRAGEASMKASESHSVQSHIRNMSGAASWDGRTLDDDDDEVREDEEDAEADEVNLPDENEGSKVWRVKRILRKFVYLVLIIQTVLSTRRSHLDAVRAVAFHSQEMCLATGGDDCTIKVWRLDPQSLSSST